MGRHPGLVASLKCAQTYATAPTVYLGLRPDGGPWTLRDRALAEGLAKFVDDRNRYGIPYETAFDPENAGWFTVTPRVDHSVAAIEQWRADNAEAAKEPGLILTVALEKE